MVGWAISRDAQGLLLALSSGITPTGAQEPIWDMEDQPHYAISPALPCM